MAVGIIIRRRVRKIVSSLVDDIIMRDRRALGHMDFSNLFNQSGQHSLRDHCRPRKRPDNRHSINGLFLNTVINFLIVAFAIFLLLRIVNRCS